MTARDYDDLPLADSDHDAGHRRFDDGGHRDSGDPGSGKRIAILALLVLGIAAIGWYLWKRQSVPSADTAAETAPPVASEPAPDASPAPMLSFTMPTLDASDPVIRELLTQVSNSPKLAGWLASDDLVRRFVATIDNLAEGASPATHIRFLTPDAAFRVRPSRPDGPLVIDPATYARYDANVDLFVNLPTENLARLYRELHPLFDQAYGELGYPGRTFDDRLRQAISNLVAVDLPAGPVEVKPRVTAYEFADPGLEGRSPAAKHLMRLGPDNARRVQAKLRELQGAIRAQAR